METNHAKDQARAQLACIRESVDRLRHAQMCEDEDCRLPDEDDAKAILEYHDEDDARDAIQQDVYSVDTRSNWGARDQWDAAQYSLLLQGGGPSVRLIGNLENGEPETAQLEYQDWGTPWTRLTGLTDDDVDALLAYAGCFYFGE